MPIDSILQVAGWSNAKTFAQFYSKNVEGTNSSSTFSAAVLTE